MRTCIFIQSRSEICYDRMPESKVEVADPNEILIEVVSGNVRYVCGSPVGIARQYKC